MELTIDEFGTFLGLKSERVQIKRNGKVESELPLFDLEQITITSRGVTLSTDLIEDCTERGIQINFLTFGGKPYAKITSPCLSATIETRREQLMSYMDGRGIAFVTESMRAKTKNQINLLKYFGKYRKRADTATFDELSKSVEKMTELNDRVKTISGYNIDEARSSILSIEGQIGELYWGGFRLLLPEDVVFERREHRGTSNLTNSVINYGYGILYSRVWGACLLAGLEPFAGFLHVDRPGKPSLVLDLVEEFRQPIVDRAILAWINKGGRPESDADGLTKDTRRSVADVINQRLDSTETYDGNKHKLRHVIVQQARLLASFVRGKRVYRGFTTTW